MIRDTGFSLYESLDLILTIIAVLAALGYFTRTRFLGGELTVLKDERDYLKSQVSQLTDDRKTGHPEGFLEELYDLQVNQTHQDAVTLADKYMGRQIRPIVEASLTRAEAALTNLSEDGSTAIEQAEYYLDQARLFARNDPAIKSMEDQIKQAKDDPLDMSIDPHLSVKQLIDIGRKLQGKALYIPASQYLETARAKALTENGANTQAHFVACDALGVLKKEIAQYAQAERLLVMVKRGMERMRKDSTANYAANLNNLADLYRAMGRFKEAEPLYTQAIKIDKTTIGETHPDYATQLNNLANLYRAMGRLEEAEPLFKQATEIDKATIGETHPDYAIDLNNLATLYRDMGRLEMAEPLFKQAIEIGKATIGETHPDYATQLNNLANLYRAMGRLEEAEPLCKQAIEIGKATIGETHPEYAIHLNNLANLYRAMGRLEEAEPLYKQAIEIDKTTIGETHPHYAIRLNNLAALYRDMGRFEEAEPLFQQAILVAEAALGADHPNTRKIKANYAAFLAQRDADGT